MLSFKKVMLVLISAILLLHLTGCEKKGTIQRAGENLDRGMKNIDEEVNQAISNVKKALE